MRAPRARGVQVAAAQEGPAPSCRGTRAVQQRVRPGRPSGSCRQHPATRHDVGAQLLDFAAAGGPGTGTRPPRAEAQACGTSPVAIIGGGNSAGQAALFLSRTSAKVYIMRTVKRVDSREPAAAARNMVIEIGNILMQVCRASSPSTNCRSSIQSPPSTEEDTMFGSRRVARRTARRTARRVDRRR
jgi:hypothetical protein